MKLLSINKTLARSTLVGLALPLLGMPLWNILSSAYLKPVLERNTLSLLGSLITAGMALAIIAIVVWGEKKPLSSMGLHRQTPRSIIIALLASIIISVGGTLISLALIKVSGLAMPTLLTEKIKDFPIWLAIWIVLSSSIAEEILYRGFLIERLGQLTGNIWTGGLITLIWFTAMHLPLGVAYCLAIVLPTSALITALYIWRRDLIATIITHLVMNAPIALAAILFALAR